jgi:hypothetical protein
MRRARCLFSSHYDVLDGRATLRESFSHLSFFFGGPSGGKPSCHFALVGSTHRKCMMNCRSSSVVCANHGVFEFIIRRLATFAFYYQEHRATFNEE